MQKPYSFENALKTLILSQLNQGSLYSRISPPKSKRRESLSTEIHGDLISRNPEGGDLRRAENKDGGK